MLPTLVSKYSVLRRLSMLLICFGVVGYAHAQPLASSVTAETWEVLRLGGSDMGYAHITQRPIEHQGKDAIETVNTTHLRVKRFGQTVAQTLRIVSTTLPSGELVRYVAELGSEKSQLVVRGRVSEKRLHLTVESVGQRSTQELAWDKSYRGPFAIEQSLRRTPPPANAKRQFRMLIPVYNQVAKVTLQIYEKERVQLLDNSRSLYKVACHTQLPSGQELVSTLWVDDDGEIWRSRVEGIGQEAYRSTQSRARKAGLGNFDLGQFTVVPLKNPPRNFARAQSVTYQATLAEDDPVKLFMNDDWQFVEKLNDHVARLTVGSAARDRAGKQREKEYSQDDLAANSLVQTGDRRVMQIARSVVAQEQGLSKVAGQLAQFVHRNMTVSETSEALASAAEVAKTMDGDCTEHAVLLVALCRVRKIPARVVMGLVHVPALNGFAYHRWAEAWLDERWVALDATRPDGKIGVGHLKMAVSNLKGVSPYEAFLPVMQAMGRLQLRVVSSDAP